jgi:hypothetical protein
MTAVVSLHADPGGEAVAVIDAVGRELGVAPVKGADGSWEFSLEQPYPTAHAAVVQALGAARPDWPALVALDYVLAV